MNIPFVSLLIAVIVVCIVVIGICIYRHKWDIRFWMMTRNTQNRKITEMENQTYEYDAYLLYSDTDTRWVSNVFVPHIERGAIERFIMRNSGVHETPLTLYIPARDCCGGLDIYSQMFDGMKQSRKIIIILTPEFCSDAENVNDYGIRLANQMSFERGYNVILPLYLREIDPPESSVTVVEFLRYGNYLRIPQTIANLTIFNYEESEIESENRPLIESLDAEMRRQQRLRADTSILPHIGADDIEFWTSLRSSIMKLQPRTPTCQCGKAWQGGIDENAIIDT